MEYKELGSTQVKIPAIGMGTWEIGGGITPDYSSDEEGILALRKGIELGMTLIDTAEMYGKGHSEEVVAEAIKIFPRENIFIVTKVLPENLRFKDLINAAHGSLKRLRTNYIDLYLIHAPNPRIPIKETMEAMESLVNESLVRFIGVSNFNVYEMEEARKVLKNTDIVVNQVEYNLTYRKIERDILPYCIKNNITVMAYCPLGRGVLPKNQFLREIGLKYNKTAAQVALNWLIQKERVMAIPKSSKIKHVIENAQSTGWRLSIEDIEIIEKFFR
ncbi:MAG: aldo/keto reductase [Thermodesulfovibrio sp.]|nr:aldo/keto reductase [Thermodesulfovibrio sp.]MDW7998881.1 aldo/keto reductase [Thermodesulfovibrio sp.]